ncbi:MAG: DUF362 domain-containing protein [Armatimonadetes bacterium]|nr:DUF362 domain-containing protein [Armatimonadota bacterium]
MTTVSLVRCPSYEQAALGAALDRALAPLGGLEAFVRRGDRVLVKPNLLAGEPSERATTTHPALIETLLRRLLDLGARPVIGDDPAFGTLERVCEACGVAEVARRYGVPLTPFNRPMWVKSPRPRVRPTFCIDQAALEADVILNVPKLKAHRQLYFTAAIKSLYGCMPGKRKAFWHMACGPDARFARLLVAFAYTVRPALTVVDGVVAMERDGPKGGDPFPLGLLFAGTDVAAVDTLIAAVIHARPADSLLLNAACQLDIGTPWMAKIAVAGESLAACARADFRLPDLVGTFFSPTRLARSIWRNYRMTRLSKAKRGMRNASVKAIDSPLLVDERGREL